MARVIVALLLLVLAGALFIDAAVAGAFASTETSAPATFQRDGPVLRTADGLTRGALGFGREAIVIAPLTRQTRELASIFTSRAVRVTVALTARDVVDDPAVVGDLVAQGHDVAFAGIGADVNGLPEPIATAVELVGLRMVESRRGASVVVFAGPSALLAGPNVAREAARAERIGLVAVTRSTPPADGSALDGLVVVANADEAHREIAGASQRGVSLVTAATVAGIARADGPPAIDIASGVLLVSVALLLVAVHDALLALALLATLLIVVRLVIVVILAVAHARRTPPAGRASRVAVLVPAHNEARVIDACVRALLASQGVELEIVVIDDGSTDDTSVVALRAADGDPRLRVVRQDNAGKAVALRRGLALTDAPTVVVVDADSLIERRAIAALVAPLADPLVGATAGNVKVGNRASILGAPQHLEYVMGINLDRRFFDVVNAVSVVPGALGAFRREAIERVGGFPVDTLAEDADLTLAIGAAGYRVRHVPHARVWTEVPVTPRLLYRQRFRWSYGMLQVLWKHRAAVRARGATNVGRLGLPYVLVYGYALPLLAPAIDVIFVRDALVQGSEAAVVLFGVFTLAQVLAATLALRLDGESLRWSLLVIPMQLGYRQLLSAVTFAALWSALAGLPVSWGAQARRGLGGSSPTMAR
ncbi:MAG: glycosyltransferase family 2 protein [Dehalococcoidia bacterium]